MSGGEAPAPGARGVRRRVAGWGRYPEAETALHRPERLTTLTALVAGGDTLIARGCGASYGDASFNGAGGTVLTERFNRFLDLDPDTGVLACESGVTVEEVLRHLLPRGFFPPVSPGTRYVTLGGCVACDVHGKNHHRSGSLADHLLDLRLLLASGEIVRCSRAERSDLFWATVGGMGLTGVILDLRLRLGRVESPWLAVDHDRARDLDAALRLFEDDPNYLYSVAWLDALASGRGLGRSVLMRGNPMPAAEAKSRRLAPAPREPRRLTVPAAWPAALLNRATVGAFNALYARLHRTARGVPVHYAPFFYPLDRLRHWNRLYGSRGFLQYQCLVPVEGGREALVRILEATLRGGHPSYLAVLKRFGPTDPSHLLSFPRPGYTLALDFPRRPGLFPVLDRLDEIVAEAGGRVYLAKDARLSPDRFRAMYPEAEAWRAVKRRVDPGNRFRSDLAARLELLP